MLIRLAALTMMSLILALAMVFRQHVFNMKQLSSLPFIMLSDLNLLSFESFASRRRPLCRSNVL
jgi:hypothetical protein